MTVNIRIDDKNRYRRVVNALNKMGAVNHHSTDTAYESFNDFIEYVRYKCPNPYALIVITQYAEEELTMYTYWNSKPSEGSTIDLRKNGSIIDLKKGLI